MRGAGRGGEDGGACELGLPRSGIGGISTSGQPVAGGQHAGAQPGKSRQSRDRTAANEGVNVDRGEGAWTEFSGQRSDVAAQAVVKLPRDRNQQNSRSR